MGVVLVVSSGAALGLVEKAGATGPTSGAQVPGAAAAVTPFTAGTPFSSGQQINVVVPANSLFTPAENLNVVECQAPGGIAPPDPSFCDGVTINGPTLNANGDGSVDFQANTGSLYTVFALPDKIKLHEPSSGPTCNLSTPCVLYIGLNQNDFTANHVFSQTFFIAPNSDDLGGNPGDGSAPPAATPDPLQSKMVATSLEPGSPTTVVANGSDPGTLTVTLFTNKGAAVPNKTVTVTPSGGSSVVIPESSGSDITNSSGVATFSVTDNAVENLTYTAVDQTDSPKVTVTQTAAVDFVAPTVSAANSQVAAADSNPQSGSPPSTTITVTLKDQASTSESRPVAGKLVTLTGTGSATIAPNTPQTSSTQGQAVFTVSDGTIEPVTFTARDTTDSVTVGTVKVTFGLLAVSSSHSTVAFASPIASTGSAGGEQVTVTVRTAADIPVPGVSVTVAVTLPSNASAPMTPVTTDTNGRAQFLVTDLSAETVTVSAQDVTDSPAINLGQASVTFQVPAPSSSVSTMVPASPTVVADGTTTDDVRVTINDQFGFPVPGQLVTISRPSGANAQCPPTTAGNQSLIGVTDNNGQVIFNCNSVVAEADTFSATDMTAQPNFVLQQQASITFTAGTVDQDRSTVDGGILGIAAVSTTEGSPNITISGSFPALVVPDDEVSGQGIAAGSTIVSLTGGTAVLSQNATATGVENLVFAVNHVAADGTTPATVTVTLFDFFGNPVSGKVVQLTTLGGHSILTTVNATTDTSGQAIFRATDGTQEVVSYSAIDMTDANLPITTDGVVVFGNPPAPPPAVSFSDVTATPNSVAADGTSTAIVTVMLSDSSANFVPGKTVTLSAGSGSSKITTMSGTTGSNGQATFAVSDAVTETVPYTATDSSDNVVLESVPVTFTASTAGGSLPSGSSGTTTTTTTAPPATTVGNPSSSSPSSSTTPALATTGAPALLPFLLGGGLCLVVIGSLGRRRTKGALR
jgi:adhesin/invasin